MKHWTLMPGAEVIEVNRSAAVEMAQLGIPPCIKVWLQKRMTPPRVLVLPDTFFRRGVVQVCLEFFLYHFLFVQGKAYGRLPEDARLTLVGTEDQLRRARRVLEVTLFGFKPEEMRAWTDLAAYGGLGRRLPDQTLHMLRHLRTWFTPKKCGFSELRDLVRQAVQERGVPTFGSTQAVRALSKTCPPLVADFVDRYRNEPLDEIKILAWEHSSISLDDAIEWRAYDSQGRARLLGDDVFIEHGGNNEFRLVAPDSAVTVNLNFEADQAPYLIMLPPAAEPVVPDVFQVLCLGSDSGFEVEHPTTGFAICLNGQWAVVDAPVCASYMLGQYGIHPTDVRVVLETHGHEDHMGSGIHFLLECLTAGHCYSYVAAEPVYRTCLVKVAAILGVTEEEAEILLNQGFRAKTPGRARALRIRPGEPVRMLGATWHFVWMVHPVPTTGFRIELAQGK
ncbi:MAG TPA: MBL fold metallo-hydrolase, partial [Candidatus Xenobia bacterium]